MNLLLDKKLADFLREVRRAVPGQKVYLVGGAVRDLVLGRAVKDLDFVVADGSVQLAKNVRRRCEGVWYSLDDEHQTARVILKQGQPDELVLDFTAFIGGNLEDDLRQRDFTINAMAIDLDNLDEVIDPLGGQEDLRYRRLCLGNPLSLLSDPLRVLRAVRMVHTFDLGITIEIIEQLRVATKEINRISGERIRDELLKCLAEPGLAKTCDLLREFGILAQLQDRVFKTKQGENLPADTKSVFYPSSNIRDEDGILLSGLTENGGADLIQKRLSALEELLLLIEGNNSLAQSSAQAMQLFSSSEIQYGMKQALGESLQGGRTRKQLLILFALFFNQQQLFSVCDEAKSESICLEFAEKLTNALMLGQKEQKFLELVCVGYQRMLFLPMEAVALQHYHYFKDVGSFGLESALLHIIEQSVSSSPNEKDIRLANKIILTWFTEYDSIVDPPRLVSGDDLLNNLQLQPGPDMGFYLESVREAQVVGKVRNRDEALALVLMMMKEGKNHVR